MYSTVLKWIVYFLFSLCIAQAYSAELSGKSSEKKESISSFKEILYVGHRKLSNATMISTNWIDSFFGNKKYLEEQNGTRLRLYHIFSKRESTDLTSETAFKFNLRFPNLEKRLQFSIEKKGSSELATTATPESRLSTEANKNNTDLRAGASYYLKQFVKVDAKLTAGFKLEVPPKDIPPKLFANFRLSKVFKISENWSTKAVSNSFWLQKDGVGESVTVDFDRVINKNLLFRFINESTWLDSTSVINTAHGPTLFQRLSSRRAISYNGRFNYSSKPKYRLQNIIWSVSYRQNILKNWFFYELTPFAETNKLNNFNYTPGVSFKLELVVGEF